MSGRDVADKYIERGGYVHGGERDDCWASDLLCLGSFIAWHDDKHMMGGYQAKEAWIALCRLLDLHPVEFRKIIRPPLPRAMTRHGLDIDERK